MTERACKLRLTQDGLLHHCFFLYALLCLAANLAKKGKERGGGASFTEREFT